MLEAALKLFGRRWRTLTACAFVVAAPVQALGVLAVLALAPDRLELGGDPAPLDSQDPELVAAGGALQMLQLLTFLLAVAACSTALVDAREGRETSAGRSLGAFARRLPAVLVLYLAIAPCLLLGFAALVLPSVWLATVWSLAVPALLAERGGALAALGRSYRLVQGRFWAMLLVLVGSVVALLLAQLVLGGLLGGVASAAGAEGQAAGAVVTGLAGLGANAVVMPLAAAILWGAYLDRRAEEDGALPPAEEPSPAGPPSASAPSGWQPPVAPEWPPRRG